MQIEVILGESPIHSELEAQVRVLSDDVVTVPKILKDLSPDQALVLEDYDTGTPVYYWIPKPEQREDTKYIFEEYWSFRERPESKRRREREEELAE